MTLVCLKAVENPTFLKTSCNFPGSVCKQPCEPTPTRHLSLARNLTVAFGHWKPKDPNADRRNLISRVSRRLPLAVHNHIFVLEICDTRSRELVLLKHDVEVLEEDIADHR